jgi:hypothetical protein
MTSHRMDTDIFLHLTKADLLLPLVLQTLNGPVLQFFLLQKGHIRVDWPLAATAKLETWVAPHFDSKSRKIFGRGKLKIEDARKKTPEDAERNYLPAKEEDTHIYAWIEFRCVNFVCGSVHS